MAGVHRIGRAACAAFVAVASGLVGGLPTASASSTDQQTYLVVYNNQTAVPSDASASIARAGGRLVTAYDEIGVAIAVSNSATFHDNVRQDANVQDAARASLGTVHLKDRVPDHGEGPDTASLPDRAPTDNDSLSGLQWDMQQIKAPEAHRIARGSRSVVVGDIDTGLDFQHPDLKQNIDFADSASCIGGSPNTAPSAWNDNNGHGTHTAGTIAAASNGIAIAGVAPNVRIAAIKAGDEDGFFFSDAVVCAFMWAGKHHIDVTNNSYFADPFYFNCPNDANAQFRDQERAILVAEGRALRFAQNHGVAVVAAEGNFSDDLAHPTQDATSPDNTTPVTRPVDRSCLVIPTMEPGVVVVWADGNLGQKSFYSSYGLGVTDVTAPGGDSVLQHTPAAPNGRVLSTWPPNDSLKSANQCLRTVVIPTTDSAEPDATYCYLQGTSMASPHVAGVAALILSRLGNRSDSIARLRTLVDLSTDPIACPAPGVLAEYAPFPSVNNGAAQTCTGSRFFNSWYGHGQINALKAVTGGEGGE